MDRWTRSLRPRAGFSALRGLLLLSLVAHSAGCGPGGARECATSSDCEAGQVCVAEVCAPSPDSGPAPDAGPSDAAVAAAAADAFDAASILGANLFPDFVTSGLQLTSDGGGEVTVTWSSSAPGVVSADGAVVRPTTGDAEVTLTATFRYGDASAVRTFRVVVIASPILTRITISPASIRLAEGLTDRFRATAHYSDGSARDVTAAAAWSSSEAALHVGDDPDFAGDWIAAVEASELPAGYLPKGYVTRLFGHAVPGAATVTASFRGQTATATYEATAGVLESIAIDPVYPIPLHGSRRLVARGTFVENGQRTERVLDRASWSSSAPGTITVDGSGVASALGAGSATLTASLGGISGALDVSVETRALVSARLVVDSPTLAIGGATGLHVVGTFDDGGVADLTAQATISASNPTVGRVRVADDTGSVTLEALSAGEVTLTASTPDTAGGILDDTARVEVLALAPTAIRLDPPAASMPIGDQVSFRVIGIFEGGAEQVLDGATLSATPVDVVGAGVDALTFVGLASGDGEVEARFGSLRATASVEVTRAVTSMRLVPAEAGDLYEGQRQTFTLRARYDDGTEGDMSLDGVSFGVDGDPSAPRARHIGDGVCSR